MKLKDPLIWIKKDALDSDFCSQCIKKFESDDRKYPGVVGKSRSVQPTIKTSTDLYICNLPGWEEESKIFYNSLSKALSEYFLYVHTINEELNPFFRNIEIVDSGYQIQKTIPKGFYTWHDDFLVEDNRVRALTYIWYLNNVKSGGYTEFINGDKVNPETGKLMIFPSTWTYLHRGYPPASKTKYIVTGWASSLLPNYH